MPTVESLLSKDSFGLETIAAVATPIGVGGVGIIRISGVDALSVLSKISCLETIPKDRYFHKTSFIDPRTKEVIDEGGVLFFKGPRSYTGEDVVELHCHSSLQVLRRLLGILLGEGVRAAAHGEFTKRAFINGKFDLTQAEAVADLISSKTETTRSIALSQLKGGLLNRITQLRAELMRYLEQIEGSIDFPDEVDRLDKTQFLKGIEKALTMTTTVLDQQDFGKYVHSGVKCLIVGYPNVGKSSFMNALLGENRALVTDIPGTTRDFIESTLTLSGILFELIDTAGVRQTEDTVEAMGIARVHELAEEVQAVFWVVDQSRALNQDELKIADLIKDVPKKYLLLNKSDLETKALVLPATLSSDYTAVSISALTQSGISEFKEKLISDFSISEENMNLDLVCNVRQINCFTLLKESLESLCQTVKEDYEDDALAVDLKIAIKHLGELTGEALTEEVLDGVFHRFCVGK